MGGGGRGRTAAGWGGVRACALGSAAVALLVGATVALESTIGSTVPRGGKLVVIVKGAYGERMLKIASVLGIETSVLQVPENRKSDPRDVEVMLRKDASITNVAIVHCETTTGMICPIGQIGQIVKSLNRIYFVDAMSSFGAVPISMDEAGIDFLVSSANKCIEGVPGFAFALVRRDALVAGGGGWVGEGQDGCLLGLTGPGARPQPPGAVGAEPD